MPAIPIALVTAECVAEHLVDADVVVAEVDEDTSAYQTSHIPVAVGFDWRGDFQDPLRRSSLSQAGFAHLMERTAITSGHRVVVHGGSNNWFAASASWYFTIDEHNRVSLMDGGPKRWDMQHRQLTSTKTERLATQGYQTKDPDDRLRDHILSHFVGAPAGTALVDVRTPAEHRGKKLAPEHLPGKPTMVAGPIPGAVNIPWSDAVDPDTGALRPQDDRDQNYADQGIRPYNGVVAYCAIGERSAHTWFALSEPLGFDKLRNCDGSWTEYDSLIDIPIER